MQLSEQLDPNTLTSENIILRKGSNTLAATAQTDPANPNVLKIHSALPYSSDISLTLNKNIKDLAGNNLAPATKTFKTAAQTNFPPQFAHVPDQTTNEDTPKTVDLKAYLTDDHPDQVAVTAGNNTNIGVTIDANKIATFTPALNWSGAENIIFTASVSEYTARDTVKVTVSPVNDAPVADFDAPETLEANIRTTLDASQKTTDAEDPKELVQIRWKIGGADWSEWTTEKKMSFYGAFSTTAVIKLQAKDSEGAVSEKTKNIQITPDITPPKVVRTNAQDGFSIKNNIEVYFTEIISPLTLNQFRVETQNGEKVNGRLSFNQQQNKLEYKFTSYLQQNQIYRVIVPAGMVDMVGNQFDGNGDGTGGDAYVHEFRTEQTNDIVPPKIVRSNLSNSVGVSDTLKLYILDTESLRRELVTSDRIKVKKAGVDLNDVLVKYDDTKHEIIVCRTNPDLSFKPWDYLTDHTLTISKDVKDLGDNSFDGNGDGVGGDDYLKAFRTEAVPDTVSPKIIADNLTSGFNVYGTLEFTANEALDPSKINIDNIILERSGGVRVYGTASYNHATNKISFQPNSRLEFATDYAARALKNITDLKGNLLDGNGDGTGGDDYVKTFRTQDKPSSSPVARMNASPAQGFVPLLETLSDAGSTDAEDAPSSLQGNASWGDGSGTGWKSLDQLVNQQHTYNSAGSFTITYQVRDTDGKIGTTTKTVNIVQPDTEPPYVNLTNLSNNFSVNGDITFTFNEPVKEPSIVVSLKKGSTNVSFSQNYNGSSKTLTVDAASPYAFSINLTVNVSAEDLSGNRLDGDRNGIGGDAYSQDFTTQSAPNDPPNSDFELDKTSGAAPVAVTLNASNSTDDHDPSSNLQKKIDWGDGTVTDWQSSNTGVHTFNNPGSYTVTLYVKDTGGLEDGTPKQATIAVTQPTIQYTVRGTVGALIEGGSLSDVTVRAGGKTATTDGSGQYEMFLPPGTYTVTAEKTTYYTRTLDNIVITNDKDLPLDLISGNLDMTEFNRVCRSRGRIERIISGKTVYFITNYENSPTTPVEKPLLDRMRRAITDLSAFCPYRMGIVEGDNPPWGQDGYFIVGWNWSIGNSFHAEKLNGDVITYAKITIGSGGELQEISQSTGARADATKAGVFGGGSGYTQHDLMMGKVLFNRNPGNRSPDRN